MAGVRYFEVDMINREGNDCYSMCIKADHEPTKREVKKFLAKDMEKLDYTEIAAIMETTLEEAKNFYDMENEENFPVLQ